MLAQAAKRSSTSARAIFVASSASAAVMYTNRGSANIPPFLCQSLPRHGNLKLALQSTKIIRPLYPLLGSFPFG